MPDKILSDISASVSELKKNPMATVGAGQGFPVAILNRNRKTLAGILLCSGRALRKDVGYS